MVSIYDVHARKLIEKMALELKKMPEMAPPEWSIYVKTGNQNMRPPAEPDWWYIRSAAVLRSVYKLGPIGVSKLRTKYGGRKNRGVAPDKTVKASGNILRKILQKLEIIGFVKQTEVGVHKGRIITPKGKSFVDKLVIKVKNPYKATKTQKTKKVAEKPQKEEKKIEVKEKKPAKDEKPKPEVKKEPKKKEKKAEQKTEVKEIKPKEKKEDKK